MFGKIEKGFFVSAVNNPSGEGLGGSTSITDSDPEATRYARATGYSPDLMNEIGSRQAAIDLISGNRRTTSEGRTRIEKTKTEESQEIVLFDRSPAKPLSRATFSQS